MGMEKFTIGIHHDARGFSRRWIKYCEENNCNYVLVNCFSNTILQELKGCAALMWNWYHDDFSARSFAKQLIPCLEGMGLIVFPDFKTCWHYDDKIAQKYLLESIQAPIVDSYVFYSKDSALDHLLHVKFPIVFKTRWGAGSTNVRLIKDKRQYIRNVNKAFSTGFPAIDRSNILLDSLRDLTVNFSRKNLIKLAKSFYRLFFRTKFERMLVREKGYFYFQKFISGNKSDIRVIVIGDKAFAIRRLCREGDFRASGSGLIEYDPGNIPMKCLSVAFETSRALGSACLAYDFVLLECGEPRIIEISYAFSMEAYDHCPGYWDDTLQWQEGPFNPQYWMVEDLLEKIEFAKV